MEITTPENIIKTKIKISPRLIIATKKLRDIFLDFSKIVATLRRAAIKVNINYFKGAEATSIP